MLKVDTHQHFWNFDPIRDSWITDDMAVIQKDFTPADLQPVLEANGMNGSVVVQSNQSEKENDFQLANAAGYDFIQGVVGWVDLKAGNIKERLEHYKQFKKMKGFRHVLQGEPDRAKMLQPAFKKGIGLLSAFEFTYDILIYPDQLIYVPDLVSAFPYQHFVIDHAAKPYIKDKKIDEWRKDMLALAQFPNLYCKISGMVTEADWYNWRYPDFTPYLDVLVESFGIKRLMFGSDWPVCLVAASYSQVLGMVTDYFSSFSEQEQDLIFGGNAVLFYHLS